MTHTIRSELTYYVPAFWLLKLCYCIKVFIFLRVCIFQKLWFIIFLYLKCYCYFWTGFCLCPVFLICSFLLPIFPLFIFVSLLYHCFLTLLRSQICYAKSYLLAKQGLVKTEKLQSKDVWAKKSWLFWKALKSKPLNRQRVQTNLLFSHEVFAQII